MLFVNNSFFLKICCFKSMNCCKQDDTSDLARAIGIGPALFLMTTKAMGWFFFFISILNLPVLYFYYTGNQDNTENSVTMGNTFARLTLGNIGQDSITCGSFDYYSVLESANSGRSFQNWISTSVVNANA